MWERVKRPQESHDNLTFVQSIIADLFDSFVIVHEYHGDNMQPKAHHFLQ